MPKSLHEPLREEGEGSRITKFGGNDDRIGMMAVQKGQASLKRVTIMPFIFTGLLEDDFIGRAAGAARERPDGLQGRRRRDRGPAVCPRNRRDSLDLVPQGVEGGLDKFLDHRVQILLGGLVGFPISDMRSRLSSANRS
jgi:hypothetical protein